MTQTEKIKILEGIIQDIFWMARRYAEGRQSYAPGMYNDAIIKAMSLGMRFEMGNKDEDLFANDAGIASVKQDADLKAKCILTGRLK